MKLAICEDEQISRNILKDLINQWGLLHHETVQQLCYESAEEMQFKQEEWSDASGVILDIELESRTPEENHRKPGLNGMELAKKIRSLDEHMPILFATGYERYVFEGYEVGAISYLMKPIDREKLYRGLDKMAELNQNKEFELLTDSSDETLRIRIRDIRSIESDGHYTTITTKDGRKTMRRSISELAQSLDPGSFLMPHRSYLVNVAHISRMDRQWIWMDNGDQVPVARGKWDKMNQAYLSYYRRIL